MSAIFPIVSNERVEKVVKDFRGIIFPEDAVNDRLYELNAQKMMKKLMGVNIMIKPEKTIGTMDFKRIK